MGKSSPSAPPAPDPIAVANAQGAANKETALTEAQLNRVNQYGPNGSVVYSSNADKEGQWFSDAMERDRLAHQQQGKEWNEEGAKAYFEARNPYANSYNVTTTLSPEMQQIADATRQAQTTYGNIGNAQLQSVQSALSKPYQNPYSQIAQDAIGRADAASRQPINTDFNKIRQESIDAAMSRLNPMFARDEEAMRSRLLASGIGQNNRAWSSEYSDFNQGKNDARMQAILNAENLTGQSIQQTGMLRQMPINEAGQILNMTNAGMTQGIAERTQPLNEAASLLTGQQVQIPGMSQVPQSQIAPTDIMGTYGMNQSAQDAAYKGRLSAYNANMGGMYGLGSAAIIGGAALMSDRRLKTDIRKVGKTDGGSNLYFYRYKDDPTEKPHIGVMAQELKKTNPDAVLKVGGFYAVDYDKVK